MFGNDSKREHEKIISKIEAKALLVAELIKKANLSKLVVLKKNVLKLDFIVSIEECSEQSDNSASITYFDFEFDKSFYIQSTKNINVKKSDMSFQDVLDDVKSANWNVNFIGEVSQYFPFFYFKMEIL